MPKGRPKKYLTADEKKLALRRSQQKYNQSKKGKAARKKYFQSEKGEAAVKKYFLSEKGKLSIKKNYRKRKESGKIKQYLSSEKNKVMVKKAQKKYNQSEKGKAAQKKYFTSEKGKIYVKKYRKTEKYSQSQKKWRSKRLKNDPFFRIRVSLNASLNQFLKIRNQRKASSILGLIGCSKEELIKHLEKQFYPNPKTGENMTWQNHSLKGWHIDHVKPFYAFKHLDINKLEVQKEIMNYKNLQPLWAEANIKKSSKF